MESLNRLKLLRITICLGLLVGIAFSHEAWFPVTRTFPRAPLLFALPERFVFPFEWLFSSILVIALALIIFLRRPKILLLVAIFSVLLLSFFDQLHFQPWVYQYVLIFAVLCFHDWNTEEKSAESETLGMVQIIIAGFYFWSGVQKLNFNFSHDILPSLLMPLQNLFPSVQLPFTFFGIAIPLTELLTGCGLLFRKTRNLAVCLAITIHAIILFLLISKNYNSVVWIWSLTLVFALIFAFWKTSVSLKEAFTKRKFTPVKLLIFACLTLPVLNFFGMWDYFLSGAYYSGNILIPAIRINEEVFEKLPPTAKATVFQTKTTGEKMLPPFEWSIADTNAPIYLEHRVFRKVALEVCKLTSDKESVELIVRERPSIIDGHYEVTRISCAELEKP